MDVVNYNLFSLLNIIALGGALTVAPALLHDQANAGQISGSDAFIFFGVTPNGGSGDLLTATSFTFDTTLWGNGVKDFSKIPTGTPVTAGTLSLSSLGAYSFSSADGSFAAAPSMMIGSSKYTSAIVGTSGSIEAGTESLSIYLIGTFTPSGTLAAFSPNNASETLSLTETGITTNSDDPNSDGFGSFSVSATFASPAASSPSQPVVTPTPEPESAVLLGASLVSLGVIRRQRK